MYSNKDDLHNKRAHSSGNMSLLSALIINIQAWFILKRGIKSKRSSLRDSISVYETTLVSRMV